MLRKQGLAAFAALAAVLILTACEKGNSASGHLFGLCEGVYYYESLVGTNPEGMPFGSDSSFEFSGAVDKIDDPAKLADGTWQMQSYLKGADGKYQNGRYGTLSWQSCFFATAGGLIDGGWSESGTCHLSFGYPSQWTEKYSTYRVTASVSLSDEGDDSSRILSVNVSSDEKKADFTVTFARNL